MLAPRAAQAWVSQRVLTVGSGHYDAHGRVLADGCLDPDPEVHQVLLGKVFPRQAEVTTIAGWADRLRHAAPRADDH
jgi:hypothetical protein